MSGSARAGWQRRLLIRLATLPLGLATLLGVAALAWLAEVDAPSPPLPPLADGIVVLTGGTDRLATGLRLLREGRGPMLLVSGVGGDAALDDLVRGAGGIPLAAGWRDRVTLGRAATSTRGNAAETAAWARARGMRSLLVVTSYYHMPRAVTELARVLPDVRLYPVAVRPSTPAYHLQWRLLADEYAKWLVAKAGLSGYAMPRDRAASAALAPDHAVRAQAAWCWRHPLPGVENSVDAPSIRF